MSEIQHTNTAEEKHTTMGTISGFVFQYYVFIKKLLTAQPDDEVSFELYDDVATKNKRAIVMCQVKHTIKSAVDEENVKLTNRASDMWKAIDVWLKLIESETKNGVKRTDDEQCDYIKQHEFVLLTNKECSSNKVYLLCKNIAEGNKVDIDSTLDEIIAEEKPRKRRKNSKENTQTFINRLKDYKFKCLFLSKMSFEKASFDSIEKDCIRALQEGFLIPTDGQAKTALEDIKKEIDIDLRRCAKTGTPLKYTYSERYKRFGQVISNVRSTPLNFHVDMQEYKKEFLDLICIKQLMKVGDFNKSDIDAIAKKTSHFLSFKNKYEELKDSYLITDRESEEFKDDAISYWDNEFTYFYSDTDSSTPEVELKRKAKDLLQAVRSHKVTLRNELNIPISNGAFYYLSDECLIGWHREWSKYFKKKQ